MPLSVTSYATYKRPPYTDPEYHSLKFVKAIKGKSFQGWADVPVLGRVKRLRPANADDAVSWFGELAAATVVTLVVANPVIFVPVPNSSSTVASGILPRTALLAQAIADKIQNAKVCDAFRWVEEMVPTHQEGTRDPQELYDNLRLIATPTRGTIILVDDVLTKGGHLRATAARLLARRITSRYALCAGRTVLETQADPFRVVQQDIPDFVPR